ncbi:unnamed protein product [Heligmosomoides polygyrus]|uniref:TSP1_spondin domain-containing protein n=1 Tax=Heligmosomoides polygyrus TaxID=6339 RepID=A0A183G7S6_HELPZ|nr:unnamed protein product [Heligmosomoides polygyrus]
MGYTAEEEPCDFLRSTTTGVMNEVQIPSIKSGSDAVFSADDEKKLEEDIQKALKPGGALRASQDEVSLSSAVANTEKARDQVDCGHLTAGFPSIPLSAFVIFFFQCEWTRWSQWSMCTVSCGTGERVRKRRCTCG